MLPLSHFLSPQTAVLRVPDLVPQELFCQRGALLPNVQVFPAFCPQLPLQILAMLKYDLVFSEKAAPTCCPTSKGQTSFKLEWETPGQTWKEEWEGGRSFCAKQSRTPPALGLPVVRQYLSLSPLSLRYSSPRSRMQSSVETHTLHPHTACLQP